MVNTVNNSKEALLKNKPQKKKNTKQQSALKQPELTQALLGEQTDNPTPKFYQNNKISDLHDILDIERIKNIGGKPFFPIKKTIEGYYRDEHEYYMTRGSEQVGPFKGYSFYYPDKVKEVQGKPLYIETSWDDDKVLMWGCDELYKTKYLIDYVQEIGGKIFFETYENGYQILKRGSETFRIPKRQYLSSIRNIGEKPVIVIGTRGNAKMHNTVMRGFDKKLGESDRVITINNLGGKPMFYLKKDGHTIPMRGFDKLGDFKNVYWNKDTNLYEMQGKPLYIATKHNGHKALMRGADRLGDIIDESSVNKQSKILQLKGNKNISNLLGVKEIKDSDECYFMYTEKEGKRIFCIEHNGEKYILTE